MAITTFETKVIDLDLVDSPDFNPNSMGAQEFETLCSLIEAEGFLQPILVKETSKKRYIVVDGDHRSRAAKRLGMTAIPAVVLPKNYSASKSKLLQLAMNQLRGTLELSDVAKSLQDIISAGDIDATLSGFNQEQINQLLESIAEPDFSDMLSPSEEKPKSGRPEKIDTYVLEIPFETSSQLKAAKKKLKAADDSGDLTLGLLNILNK